MKYARFAILLGVLVSTLVAGCVFAGALPPTGVSAAPTTPVVAPAVKPQAQWNVVVPKTNVGEKLRMAAFFDESFGLTGGAGRRWQGSLYTQTAAKTGPRLIVAGADCTPWTSWMSKRSGNVV